jgi:hypothetical protein
MKKSKCFVLGMLIVVLTFGLVFGGCISMEIVIDNANRVAVESETSKAIYNAALDLVLAKEDGIDRDVFMPALERQFPGLKVTSKFEANVWAANTALEFTYLDKKYRMRGNIRAGGTGGAQTIITSVISCVELQEREKTAQ